ncbi:hypothetical protein [Actinomadura nitritigenes]|uniref:hypothetical protein n=1 Tax=Actinomadura nitritigenes TaxID=134602 RepID=UPI003D8DE274
MGIVVEGDLVAGEVAGAVDRAPERDAQLHHQGSGSYRCLEGGAGDDAQGRGAGVVDAGDRAVGA